MYDLSYNMHAVRTVSYLGLYVSMDSLTNISFSQRYDTDAQDDISDLPEQIKTITLWTYDNKNK